MDFDEAGSAGGMTSGAPVGANGSSAGGVRDPRLWHGTSRAERDETRRQRLLDAALELYGTRGFRATTVQALCQESGVSSRSFYEVFSTQDALLEQLYAVLNEEILGALTDVSAPSEMPLIEATVAIVSTALTPMLEDERKARVLEVEAVGINESLEDARRETMRSFAAAIQAAFAHLQAAYGLPTTGVPELTSLVLVGGITEALVQRVRTPIAERGPRAAFLNDIAEVALRAHGISERRFGSVPLG